MTYSVLNKAVSNFVLFSITQGDGSHARTLIKAQSFLSEEVRNKVLDLIAKIPVPGKEREELDRLLGFTDPVSLRRPPKITAPFGTPSVPSQEGWVAKALTLSDISVQVLSFLETRALAQAMRVNSLWQKNAMHAACYSLRSAKTLQDWDLGNNFHNNILHLQNPWEYLKYFDNVLELVLGGVQVNGDLFSTKPDGTLYWKSREKVTSVNMSYEKFSFIANMASQDIRFPCMKHLEFKVDGWDLRSEIFPWQKWCPATLQSLNVIFGDISGQGVVRFLETVASLSQLTDLSIKVPNLEEMASEGGLEILCSSFPNLTGLNVKQDMGWFQDQQCEMLRSARWKLHSLTLAVDITFVGMRMLALAFPELSSLGLEYRAAGDNDVPIPKGLTVIARSWPKLSKLSITGTLDAEMVDMIMEGHPYLTDLEIFHEGDSDTSDWESGEGIKAIAKYGSHLTSLDLTRCFYMDDVFYATLGPQCQRLRSLTLSTDRDSDNDTLRRLRAAFPNAIVKFTVTD